MLRKPHLMDRRVARSRVKYRGTTIEQVFEIARIRYQALFRTLTQFSPHNSNNCGYLLGERFEVVSD